MIRTSNTESLRDDLRGMLKEFYGRELTQSSDLKTEACCTDDTAKRYGHILEMLPDEILAKQYGCGCPLPLDSLEGKVVLDLGSGAGVDAFIALHRVGPSGWVHGVDMTTEQLEVARRNAPEVVQRFGHPEANVTFHEGFIETADAIQDDNIDLVISDCVINLSPAKREVFNTIWRVLKPGGQVFISDIAADRRVPEKISRDPQLVAECLGGAEYEHDWMDQMKDAGFADPRVVSRRIVQTEALGEAITFFSLNVSAFKIPEMDRRCEDYGQMAIYLGNVVGSEARFLLDDHHLFEAQRPTAVCRNTARMLTQTRLAPYFRVSPSISHFGLFDCATPTPNEGSGPCC